VTVAVGNNAGWHLYFFAASEKVPVLSIGVRDYDASIEATMPANLEGGQYRFEIEGITNAHYGLLHKVWGAKQPLYVDLYLYWRDADEDLGGLMSSGLNTSAGADTPSTSARVARLAVTKMSRRVGARRYEAVIEASERVYQALRKRPEVVSAAGSDPRGAAVAIAQQLLASAGPPLSSVVDTGAPSVPTGTSWPRTEPRAWQTGLDALAELERSMVALSGKTGRGMYLIRNGVLHVGVRPIPLTGEVTLLSEASGLVHIETGGMAENERFERPGDSLFVRPARVQYALILKGRPDLRPGDKVSFLDPFHDAASDPVDPDVVGSAAPASFLAALDGLRDRALGSAGSEQAGSKVEMYVSGVCHRLSRTEGFVTTVTGVSAPRGADWDPVSLADGATAPDPAAMPHGDAANAIRQLARSAAGESLLVGEVRAATLSGTAEPPGQTVDVWVGTVLDDGGPARVRRLAIDREARSRASGVAYTTPFAWGKCGLVLPRYPGTRVVLGHVGGRADDPVDLGAVWESGHGPESQPGDWWLILPAAIARANRQIAEDSDTPSEPAGKASNDLIDADGARVIEVGRLTVRVQPSRLAAAGTRPAAPANADEQVTIEHENGSRIVIKDSGDIVIHSEANVTLSAKHALTLEADDVVVKVKNAMDVKGRD